jgi:cell division protein ZapE
MNLVEKYNTLIRNGTVKSDDSQLALLAKLSTLADQLNQTTATPQNFIAKLLNPKAASPRGFYVWGDVGRGKTMLMDLFFAALKTPKKQRIHFHAFMQNVHAQRANHTSHDVIAEIADAISAKAQILCLDEMQIVDIADAMIIGRLFDALEKRGVCFVTTSNLPPDELYKDGLNRQLLLPFIAKLNSKLNVVSLSHGIDYRLGRLASRQTYITPLGKKTDAEIQTIWNDLTDGAKGQPQDISLLGRTLHVPHAAHACARFSFSDLCEKPLAAPDYLALARNFRTIFIEHVPVLIATQRNETKRFILMIDTFYDMKIKLVVSAAAPASALCKAGQHRFEFHRTASRLQEMQSANWWKAA